MEKIDRATHVLKIDGDRGEVRIADEVVAIIAGMAATDVRELHPWRAILRMNWLP